MDENKYLMSMLILSDEESEEETESGNETWSASTSSGEVRDEVSEVREEETNSVNETISVLSTSSEDSKQLEYFIESHGPTWIILVLQNLEKNRTMRSTLETLLVLHYCIANSGLKNQCNLKQFLFSYDIHYLKKIMALFQKSMEYILERSSENFLKDITSHCISDYQLHLLFLLMTAVRTLGHAALAVRIYLFARAFIDMEFGTMVDQISVYIDMLSTRHGWHYRNNWKPHGDGSINPSSIRCQFMYHYDNNAQMGRVPHIFWQKTPLSKKISQEDSLAAIFLKGKEKECSICYMDGIKFTDNFSIFLNCNHIFCVPCTERLIYNKR